MTDYAFPGRWIGAGTMVLGPALLLVGTLLRLPFHYFFPRQLVAVAEHPTLMTTAHALVVAGNVLLAFAVLSLAHRIGRERPVAATWGAALVLVGLLERTFHAGIDQAAHNVVRHQGVEVATAQVSQSYQDLHLFSYLSFTILIGWPVLAYAAYRSRVFGPFRALALATTCLLPLGVLKGTEPTSVLAVAGLCAALAPTGIRDLLTAPRPSRGSVLATLIAVPVVGALAYVSTLG
ncbi:hypothetical protein ACIGNX_28165 [Actinosynnema sp. NPDC053489]|uniref:hypothetical protein n=1 Tax=Actinosynnema sp. NPDC053489 TaxID=3363916 RepID=UPI0037C56359